MQKLYTWLAQDGQTMAEYGVVLAVITIAVFGALALLAGNITNALDSRRRVHHLGAHEGRMLPGALPDFVANDLVPVHRGEVGRGLVPQSQRLQRNRRAWPRSGRPRPR